MSLVHDYRNARAGSKARRKYKFKRRPRKHQVAALKKLLSTGYGGALLMEPRTGKTQVCVDYACCLHAAGKVNRVVIFCPLGVMGVWVDEIEACCPFKHRILVWDKDGRKEKPLPPWGQDVLDFVIVNLDAAATPGDVKGRDAEGNILRARRGGRFKLKKDLRAWQPQLGIVDESHRIKSPAAMKSRLLHSLAKDFEFRVIATGTAVTKAKRTYDIYSQWKFLNPEGWVKGYTLDVFKMEFGVWKRLPEEKFDRFVKVQNIPRLRRLIHADSFAVTRDECFDLPQNTESVVPIRLGEKAIRIYEELAEQLYAQLENGEVTLAQIRLVLNVRLSQLTSGFAKTEPSIRYPEGRLVRIDRAKLDACSSLLSDLFEADEKVVVAARFRADISSVLKEVGKMRGARAWEIHGGISRADRDSSIKAFRNHQGAGVMVVQPQAASLGIDLSTASTMFWYSLTDSFVDWSQTCDRIALSPRKTNIEYLLAVGSLDYDKYEALHSDKDVVKMIQDSPQRLLRNMRE